MNKKCNKQIENEMDGLVWILNGRVFVRNEMKLGMPPMINPCEGVRLYINGMECNHLATVSESDIIELKPIDSEIDFQMDVEISEDKLKAYAIFVPPRVVQNVIVDAYPVNKLDIKVTPVVIGTKKTDRQKLMDRLVDVFHIVHGINENTLDEMCEKNVPGKFLVAEGTPATDAVDDRIEYMFDDEPPVVEYKENDQGRVDFKNIASFPSVNPGQIIARLHKGKEGTDGVDVFGNIVFARKPKRLKIMPTYSVSFNENTGEIKALRSGRPSKQIKGDYVSFHIYDTITVEEVSIKTGNVKFKGDIEVTGNVYDSMEVVARQNVLIRGSVNFSSIFSGNNITIKGAVISSKINAAMNDVVAKDPAPLMKKLIDGINRLIDNINAFSAQDMAENNMKDIPDVVRYLLNNNNRDIPGIVYEVLNTLRKGNYDIEEDFLIRFMKRTRSIMGNYSEITSVQFLQDAVSDLKSLFSEKDSSIIKGSVTLNSVLNSEVIALGDVSIIGKGCFNSVIVSKGNVTITSDVRGGQVRAEKDINVNNAGSDMGVKTLLVVPENGCINIRTAHADTTIKIGGVSHTFLSEKKMIRARLANGKLLL